LVRHHGGRCERCGYGIWPGALHFHHRVPAEKGFPLGLASMGRSWEKLCAEAAKCELLCANCHAAHEADTAVAAVRSIDEPQDPRDRWCARHGWRRHVLAEGRLRCVTCRSDAVISWYRRRKAMLVERLGGRCHGCGSQVPMRAFEFHHTNPGAKSFPLSGASLYRPLDVVLRELRECVLLCANCHAEVEAGVRVVG
jgi:hypothetical protein